MIKRLLRIVLIALATSATPGIIYNSFNALYCTLDPSSREMAVSALFNPSMYDKFIVSLPLGLVFALVITWYEKIYDAMTFSDYLFGGCIGCLATVMLLSFLTAVLFSSFILRMIADEASQVTEAVGLLIGTYVAYKLRPLDRRITQKPPIDP